MPPFFYHLPFVIDFRNFPDIDYVCVLREGDVRDIRTFEYQAIDRLAGKTTSHINRLRKEKRIGSIDHILFCFLVRLMNSPIIFKLEVKSRLRGSRIRQPVVAKRRSRVIWEMRDGLRIRRAGFSKSKNVVITSS